MSKVLFLGIPSHGHMNPTMGLANALIQQGEEITFFSALEFKESLEAIGAHFKCYKEDLNLFKKKTIKEVPEGASPKASGGLADTLLQPDKFIDDVLEQTEGQKFDYIIFSSAFPYASLIAKILDIPSVSSFAVFITLKELMAKKAGGPNPTASQSTGPMGLNQDTKLAFEIVRQNLIEKYKVELPEDMLSLLFNKGDLNIIYTSAYFVKNPEYYDDTFLFIGPPIYAKKYESDFPFEQLKGKKVIYISLGTVFSDYSETLNKLFFESFADMDAVIVMAAYNLDTSKFNIPENFIIRNYVPQLELLKYTSVAITHAGMNSIGDLLYNNIPFVSIPLGADQFYMANRAQELGATIALDAGSLTSESLLNAVEKVLNEPGYLENSRKISNSFKEAGGYQKAVTEIFKLKMKKGITN